MSACPLHRGHKMSTQMTIDAATSAINEAAGKHHNMPQPTDDKASGPHMARPNFP